MVVTCTTQGVSLAPLLLLTSVSLLEPPRLLIAPTREKATFLLHCVLLFYNPPPPSLSCRLPFFRSSALSPNTRDMPNKYSHSFVLSNYEKRGLTFYNDFEHPHNKSRSSLGRSDAPRSRPSSFKPTSHPAAQPRISTPPPLPQSRLRLRDSHDLQPLPPPNTTYRPRRLSNDTVDLAPRASVQLSSQQLSTQKRSPCGRDSFDDYNLYDQAPPSRSWQQEADLGLHRLRVTDEVDEELDGGLIFGTQKKGAVATLRSEQEITRPPEPVRSEPVRPNHVRRLTSDTAIWNPESPAAPSPLPEQKPQVSSRPVEAVNVFRKNTFAAQDPLTPPRTPNSTVSTASWEDFSLEPNLDQLAGPLPSIEVPPGYRLVRHTYDTPPASMSGSSNPSRSATQLPPTDSCPPVPPLDRPTQLYTYDTPPNSMSGRSDPSKSATRLRPVGSWPQEHVPNLQEQPLPASVHPSICYSPDPPLADNDVLEDDVRGSSMDCPEDFVDFDADLEPLPTSFSPGWESDVCPWDYPESPKLSRILRHERGLSGVSRISSRASTSSFDSAAPPPIRLTSRDGNTRKLPAILDSPRTPRPAPVPLIPERSTIANKNHKSHSFSTLLNRTSRYAHVKSIPYEHAKQGPFPESVNVSRTGTPSIPEMFSTYQGPFPSDPPAAVSLKAFAEERPHLLHRPKTAGTSNAAEHRLSMSTTSSARDPFGGAGRVSLSGGSSSRRHSKILPGQREGQLKRSSWFRSDPFDLSLDGMENRSESKGVARQ